MTEPLRHERILASAGSGKTFRLSGRAIELVRRGVPPQTLLASTFTRAAAAEIRDRVLGRLAEAVLDRKARAALAVGSGLDEPSAEEATAALERVVAAIDRLQVRTLDSLFASTVTACAAELGMPPEVRMIDEVERASLEDEAIGRMLAAEDAEALLATIAAVNKGHPGLTLGDAIRRAVEPALAIARQSPVEAWTWERPELRSAEEVRRIVAAIVALPDPKNGTQRNQLAKDRARLSEAAPFDVRAWEPLVAKGIGGKVASGESMYGRAELSPAMVDAYRPAVEHALELSRDAMARHTRAVRELADRFAAAFAEAKRRAGGATFDDLTMALADASALPDLAEVFFRLDARISHALLDEFQDTSVPQWRALRPILREIAGGDPQERSLFVVGDLKQSIYGWRGASPALLESLPRIALESGTIEMHDERLATSYRSSQVVLDAVNDVFGRLLRNPALHDADPVHVRAAEAWCGGWVDHVAGDQRLPGTVELHIAPKVGGSQTRPQQAKNLDVAAALAAELRRERPGLHIGILCRRNRSVAGILNRLREAGVPASARGVGSLRDAAAVNAILAALDLADHPDHTLAAFHVGRSPLGAIVGVDEDAHRPGRTRSRRDASRRLRAEFERRGYAATIGRWRDRLAEALDPRESLRVDQLVEAVVDADAADARERRPADVAATLRALQLDEEGGGGVTVMNIHQSKGLEFDAVVLCDVDRSFAVKASLAALRDPTRPDGDYVRVARWVAEGLRRGEVAELADATTIECYREFLSMLYVAVTRAKRGLFVVTGPAAGSKGLTFPNSFAGILRGAWCPEAEREGLAYRSGDRDALGPAGGDDLGPARTAADEEASDEADAQDDEADWRNVTLPPIEMAPAAGRRVTAVASASSRERWSGEAGEEDDEVAGGALRRRAREAGVLAHAMLESIDWLADMKERGDERGDDDCPDDDATEASLEASLEAGARRRAPQAEAEVVALAAGTVARALRRPALRAIFRRPKDLVELRREWRFVRLDADGTGLEQGIVDRLHLLGRAGRPERAVVIDFKTDRVAGDAGEFDAALRERYEPQLAAYRSAVAERFELPLEAVETCVVALDAGRVVGIHGSLGNPG